MIGDTMNPILIIQFYPSEGPGYLEQFLAEHHLPWHLLRIDQDDTLPTNLDDYSALVMMGGPMSANDELAWVSPLLALIRQAQAEHIPVLGHCLGGQLIAKALGATVRANPVREIGWGLVTPSYNATATAYFGSLPFTGFHWHGETFTLPAGATHLLSSTYCSNQAFAIGNTLAMQCHIEMTSDMVKNWCVSDADYLNSALNSPAVQSANIMQQDLDMTISRLQERAEQTYLQWIKPLLSC
jgi:GMP synthase-like glutamine amidotransferase